MISPFRLRGNQKIFTTFFTYNLDTRQKKPYDLNMFGIGTPELIIILVLALILIGPKKLPEVARAIGKGLGELRKATDGIKNTVNVNRAFHDFMDSDDDTPRSSKTSEGEDKEKTAGPGEGPGGDQKDSGESEAKEEKG
jgi:TatA/E family protein of Tat protein translocase